MSQTSCGSEELGLYGAEAVLAGSQLHEGGGAPRTGSMSGWSEHELDLEYLRRSKIMGGGKIDERALARYTHRIETRMRELGVPDEAIGYSPHAGGSGRGFHPTARGRGSNLPHDPDSFMKSGIQVEGGFFESWDRLGDVWNRACSQDRVDAIIAHEYLEWQGLSHAEALATGPLTDLPISDRARAILKRMSELNIGAGG